MKTSTKLVFLVASLWLGGPAAAAEKFYCCRDDSGKKTCGDILPSICIGRAYTEVSKDGQTTRSISAPLTPEERAKIAAEQEEHRVQEEHRKEQLRKDAALMATYSSENDIELMRESALADANKAISNAQDQISEIRLRYQKFEEQAASASKRHVRIPPEVQKGLENTALEIKAQEEIIAFRKSEMVSIQAKYDSDLTQFRKIKSEQGAHKKGAK